jgi:hypothetical protein
MSAPGSSIPNDVCKKISRPVIIVTHKAKNLQFQYFLPWQDQIQNNASLETILCQLMFNILAFTL